jgi:DNA helicase HerA-like ATPase
MLCLFILRLAVMGSNRRTFGFEHEPNHDYDRALSDSRSNGVSDEESIGVIFGTISTTQFKFAITGTGAQRTGFVQVWHDDHGWILGQIMELNLESNLSFSRARELSLDYMVSAIQNRNLPNNNSKKFDHSHDKTHGNNQDTNHDTNHGIGGKLAGYVNVIGFRDRNGIVQLPSSPFNAGQPVFPAAKNQIIKVLGLDINVRTGSYIGLLRNHNLKVHLDINSLVQKHVSVIAKTGSGKSYMVGVLVEELIKRKVPMVIIDPHGEYSSLMHPNIDEHETRLMSKYGIRPRGYPDAIKEFSLNPSINLGSIALKLPSYGFTADGISELLGLRGSGVQTSILYKALNRLNAKKPVFTIKDLISVIELDRNSAKWHLINSLENLLGTGIFSNEPTRLTDIVKPGFATMINLRGAPPQQQQLVITQLTRQLFEARKLNKIPALMLVLEEAHQFCPQQGKALSSNVLHTVASEGRKFGLGLCVVSQRPAMVNKNVLSQCNTQVILKVTNPNDLKAIIASVEGLTNAMIDEIQRLPVSVAIVIGGGITVPIFVDVRVRETKHGGKPVDIFTNVDTFHAGQPVDIEDVLDESPIELSEQLDPSVLTVMDSEIINHDDPEDEESEQNIERHEINEITAEDDPETEDFSATEQFADMKNKNRYLKSIINQTEKNTDIPEFSSMKDLMDSEADVVKPRRKRNE